MNLLEKAKELGRELKKTEEYQELERTNQQMKEDPAAQQLIQDVQEAQQRLQFSQQSGIQPTQEQIADFNQKRETLNTNITVRALMKAQEDFNSMMKQVNDAITEGMQGEDEAEQE